MNYIAALGFDIDGLTASTSTPSASKIPFYNTTNTRNESATADDFINDVYDYINVVASDIALYTCPTVTKSNDDLDVYTKVREVVNPHT